ncbi:MAG: hypothetical protein M3P32_09615 [Chloroflexota bacterium]|nr:hypothetical protein [Chloroflexota bacterium]
MDIQLADQHIYRLDDRLTPDEIRQRAMDRRTGAFGGGLESLFSRPKADDIELIDSQRRLEPFWHVGCSALYVYDRSHDYMVPASGAQVQAVSVHGEEHKVTAGNFVVSTVEHSREEYRQALFLDGVSGAPVADAQTIIGSTKHEVTDLEALASEADIVRPPEQRASFVVRQLLTGMLKPLQADTVHEESITFEQIDLYFRPWWAFEFHWKVKDKKGVVELDAVTGEMRNSQALMARLSRSVTRDSLFDIGADTVGLLVPGGSIAVKVAKMAIDSSQKR